MSYWCEEKLVIRVRGPEGEREVALENPFALVGRHSRAHVVLDDMGVRKRAILLLAIDGGIYCAYLDVEQASQEQPGRWLKDDEPLQLGPFTLTARLASGTPLASPGWNPQKTRGAYPIPVIHIYCGTLLKDRRRLRHPLVMIGRRPQCALRLRGEAVSSFHCLLYWCDQRLWCLDLASSNGTRVADELVGCRELQLNERLEVGEFSLLYYRWSPRRLTPGFTREEARAHDDQLEVAFDASLEALDDAEDGEGSVLGTSLAAVEQERKTQQWRADEERFQESLATQEAELVRLHQELEQQRTRAREELATHTAQLASEREAFAAAQQHWVAERERLARLLAQREQQLSQVGLQPWAAAERRDADSSQPNGQPGTIASAVVSGERPEKLASGEPTIEETQPVLGGALLKYRLATDEPPPVSEPLILPTTAASLSGAMPVGRRTVAGITELTSFVSGRLGDLEDSRRQRALMVWTAVTVTVLATAAAGFGLWFWLR